MFQKGPGFRSQYVNLLELQNKCSYSTAYAIVTNEQTVKINTEYKVRIFLDNTA